jgi:hypothetical protein
MLLSGDLSRTLEDPEEGGRIHACNKAEDGEQFTPFAGSICTPDFVVIVDDGMSMMG